MKERFIACMLVLILMSALLTGCSKKNIDANEEEAIGKLEIRQSTLAENDEERIINEFNVAVKGNNEPYILAKLIDDIIKDVSKEQAYQMIMKLIEVQEMYLEKYIDQLFMEERQMELLTVSEIDCQNDRIEECLFFDEGKIDNIKNENLKLLINNILQGKYRLINMEGAFYPIIDYESYKIYNECLPEEIREYIDLKSMDSNLPTLLDAEMIISFDQLAERIVRVEDYIKKYIDGEKYEEMLRVYGSYLSLYLGGSDNTPIFEYATKKITQDVLSSYKKTSNINGTIVSKIVAKYIDIIEQNDNTIDESILSKIVTLHNEAIAALEG